MLPNGELTEIGEKGINLSGASFTHYNIIYSYKFALTGGQKVDERYCDFFLTSNSFPF
jgi:hypothetical protein